MSAIDRARSRFRRIFAGFRRKDMLDGRLAGIIAPTLLVGAREDRIVHPSATPVRSDGLPDSTTVVPDGVGHLAMIEQPAQVASHYVTFLNGLRRLGPA